MKYLKVIIYALLGIMSIYLISNFFFSERFKVSTSIEIDTSPFIVFDQINNFENWENWDPWLETDTTIQMKISDIPYGVGANRLWKSKNSGNGKMEITNSEFIKQIDFEITIDDRSPFLATFYFEAIDNGVKISWENTGELPFLARIFGPVLCKMIKGDHVNGLNNLKEYCETIPSKSLEVSVQQWDTKKYISKTDTCSLSTISQSLADSYSKIIKYLTKNNTTPILSPFAQYQSFPHKPGDNDYVILRIGAFVEDFNGKPDNGLNFVETTPILSAQAIHQGDYRTIFNTYEKIKSYCKENNYTIVSNPYEIYITDPAFTPNTEDWQTRIIYEIE
jgi:effector-binding domain-containing protein